MRTILEVALWLCNFKTSKVSKPFDQCHTEALSWFGSSSYLHSTNINIFTRPTVKMVKVQSFMTIEKEKKS